ncbi:TPA: hypothetical protein DCY43_03315 [candidate division WWE3 bacterium]|uniref:Uncharacterized protein n=2 Tax=Katanobacteria TaxID=422282 RepID=A0A1F4V732_UNCKA|nr:MAG: hypothetical protein A2709_02195 [candidate division WWE3 bacterium RIFCSPHIGHO2_01_FULL_43_9]HAZ29745.1 hypothetical protein [candidate division WWE3 bacterium]
MYDSVLTALENPYLNVVHQLQWDEKMESTGSGGVVGVAKPVASPDNLRSTSVGELDLPFFTVLAGLGPKWEAGNRYSKKLPGDSCAVFYVVNNQGPALATVVQEDGLSSGDPTAFIEVGGRAVHKCAYKAGEDSLDYRVWGKLVSAIGGDMGSESVDADYLSAILFRDFFRLSNPVLIDMLRCMETDLSGLYRTVNDAYALTSAVKSRVEHFTTDLIQARARAHGGYMSRLVAVSNGEYRRHWGDSIQTLTTTVALPHQADYGLSDLAVVSDMIRGRADSFIGLVGSGVGFQHLVMGCDNNAPIERIFADMVSNRIFPDEKSAREYYLEHIYPHKPGRAA